jgi:pimeloyl-ACP methyl ester carboxylesterase
MPRTLVLSFLSILFTVRCAVSEPGEGRLEPCWVAGVQGDVQCGTYTVFEDRKKKVGRTIDIGFVILRALEPSQKLDPLVIVAGGPGQAVTPLATAFNRRYASIRRHRDLVFIDQRGTGQSNLLACNTSLPGGSHSLFGSLFPTDHISKCLQRLEQRANPKLYTTPIAADDMDEIRQWLGYERLNLVGGSYGTRFVQVYIRRHSDHVRSAILNGVVPLHRNIYLHGAKNLDHGIQRFTASCETDSSCAKQFPNFREQLQDLQMQFRESGDNGQGRDFGRGDFAYAVRGLLYSSDDTLLPQMVRDAHETGDIGPFESYYVERASWVASSFATGMHLTVVCSEDVPFTTENDVQKVTAGTFAGDSLYRRYESACRIWPKGSVSEDYGKPVRAAVPVLLLSGEWDPVTPPSWGEEVAENLPKSLHVVMPRTGDGVAGPCASSIIDRFVTMGSVEGLDTSCVRDSR